MNPLESIETFTVGIQVSNKGVLRHSQAGRIERALDDIASINAYVCGITEALSKLDAQLKQAQTAAVGHVVKLIRNERGGCSLSMRDDRGAWREIMNAPAEDCVRAATQNGYHVANADAFIADPTPRVLYVPEASRVPAIANPCQS